MIDSILYALGLIRVSVHEIWVEKQRDSYYIHVDRLNKQLLLKDVEIARLEMRGNSTLRLVAKVPSTTDREDKK